MDKQTFGFTLALSYLLQGKKVRRQGWPAESWIKVSGDFIEDGAGVDMYSYNSSSDILADDWELVG